MYNSNRSHRGSALLVGLIIVVLLTILTTTFLEKILWLGKVSGGIGNSAQAYTLATWLIEEQLMNSSMTRVEPWKITTVSNNYTSTGRNLSAYTGDTMMPTAWKWNSLFDPDWNIIGMGDPVQIVIPENLGNWGGVTFRFRVANIPWNTNTGSASNSGVILWTFGYSGASLYASGETEIFRGSDIGINKFMTSFNWVTNTGSSFRFDNFYGDATSGVGSNGAKCTNYQCTLKLSMIRPFVTLGWQSFSFLEYQIDFGSTRIPSQYMIIDSSAYILGYLRSRQVRIPQITSNTATDFAVLQ
jgi:hypothetical protein